MDGVRPSVEPFVEGREVNDAEAECHAVLLWQVNHPRLVLLVLQFNMGLIPPIYPRANGGRFSAKVDKWPGNQGGAPLIFLVQVFLAFATVHSARPKARQLSSVIPVGFSEKRGGEQSALYCSHR